MNRFKKSVLTIMAIASISTLFAQSPIYIEISDCTKELKYTYSEPNGMNYNYLNYHFLLNNYETVILKPSLYNLEAISSNSVIAMNRITCGTSLQEKLSLEIVEKIQSGQQEAYLLIAEANGFLVRKVETAAYQVYLPNDKYLRVIAQDYGFDYDGSMTYEPGTDLKTAGDGDFILFNKTSIDCYDKPTFMHVPINFMETANIEFILGIGIVRQYSELMEHQLVAVDGQPFQQYLATFCNPDVVEIENEAIPELYFTPIEEEYVETPSNKPVLIVPTVEETTVVEKNINLSLVEEGMEDVIENTATTSKGGTVIFKSAPVSRKVEENKNIHTVEAGETLYSISNKYGLKTLQLKTMNQLEGNIIEIGQKLKIKE